MSHNVFDVHSIVTKLNEGDQPQIIATNIYDPPFISMFKIIQAWEYAQQLFGL